MHNARLILVALVNGSREPLEEILLARRHISGDVDLLRKHIEALAIEPFAGCTAANLECFRTLASRKVSMRFVERVGYPMSVSGA